MKIICETTPFIDKHGHTGVDMHFVKIEEPGDRKKELADLKERANFLSSHGHKGNRWERLLRAKEENK
jgi:hypothetical protein